MQVYIFFASMLLFPLVTRGLRRSGSFCNPKTRWLGQATALFCHEKSSPEPISGPNFTRGQQVKLRVLQFGPIGASVETVNDIPDSNIPPTRGIIYRNEILLHRQKQQGEDLFAGEELDGYVERVLDDGRLNIILRPAQIVARMKSTQELIIEALEGSPSNSIPVGDKSSPHDIAQYFHGITKKDFKMAIGALYKQAICIPGAFETRFIPETDRETFQRDKNSSADGLKQRRLPEDRNIAASIFIGNLPFKISKDLLLDHTTKLLGEGKIKGVRLSLDEAGKPRGFAYLELMEESLVEPSIKQLNKADILGRKIKVDYADPLRKHNYKTEQLSVSGKLESEDKRSRRVTDLSKFATPSVLGGSDTKAGATETMILDQRVISILPNVSVTSVDGEEGKLSIDKPSDPARSSTAWSSSRLGPEMGTTKGWVHSALKDISKKDRSVRIQDRENFDQSRITYKSAGNRRPSTGPSPTRGEATLYIGNLAFSVTEEILHKEIEKFSGQGSVASVRVITDRETGRSRGFAYVEMLKSKEAEQVYNRMHNIEIMGRRINVDDATKPGP